MTETERTNVIHSLSDDPLIAYYRQFVDVEALRTNLRLTLGQRMENFHLRMSAIYEQERMEQDMVEFERGINETND